MSSNRVSDFEDLSKMNKNRPDTSSHNFRMQDGGLWSVKTVYKSQCRNLGEQLTVNGVTLTGHQLRKYLQSLEPGHVLK